jgi:hypothetical protein
MGEYTAGANAEQIFRTKLRLKLKKPVRKRSRRHRLPVLVILAKSLPDHIGLLR